MKKYSKLFFMTLLTIVCITAFSRPAAAQPKVTKVTQTRYDSNSPTYKQYSVLRGKTAAGKTVWTYKSGKMPATELTSVSYKVYKNYVYVLDASDRSFVKLHKQTGKVLLRKKNAFPVSYSHTMLIDSQENLYTMGAYRDTVYKISKKGTLLWKRKIRDAYYWPYKMKHTTGTITVYFSGDPSYKAVDINARNGKIKRYR